MEWKKLMDAGALADDLDQAWELRLRPGQPMEALFPWGWRRGESILTSRQVLQAAQALSAHGLAAGSRQLARGFLPLPGGHRLGVAGVMGEGGMREIVSLCLRIAHEVKGCGEGIFPEIREKNTLILGPPGSGKTTLLRDLIRCYGLAGYQVGVADERGEIAACQGGAPQLDVGPRADVVTGMERKPAISLLIRSMAPQVIAADELGEEADIQALSEALRCGVWVLATLHGREEGNIRRRGLGRLMAQGAFERLIVLSGAGKPPQIREAGTWDG